MINCIIYRKKLLIIFAFFITNLSFCQLSSTGYFLTSDSLKFKKNNIGIEVVASILPKAKITREEGKYELKSHLQSSYDLGINYLHCLKNNLIFSTGLHFVIGKRNFFANI